MVENAWKNVNYLLINQSPSFYFQIINQTNKPLILYNILNINYNIIYVVNYSSHPHII